jgi:hypothetical protein
MKLIYLMGVCCVQKGAISIESNNIYIENKIKKDNNNKVEKNSFENINNNSKIDENNKSLEQKEKDNYSSGPILKLLIQKSQRTEEKNEVNDT